MSRHGYPELTVLARPYAGEVVDAARPLYEGVMGVYLDGAVTILFVPPLEREPWPPSLADPDEAASVAEARRAAVMEGPYSVTPDAARAGTAEVVSRGELDEDIGPAVLFYVRPNEFSHFTRELGEMADARSAVRDGFRLSDVADRAAVRFLLERVVASEHFDPGSRRFLGL